MEHKNASVTFLAIRHATFSFFFSVILLYIGLGLTFIVLHAMFSEFFSSEALFILNTSIVYGLVSWFIIKLSTASIKKKYLIENQKSIVVEATFFNAALWFIALVLPTAVGFYSIFVSATFLIFSSAIFWLLSKHHFGSSVKEKPPVQ